MIDSQYNIADVLMYKYQNDATRIYTYLTELYREKVIRPQIVKLEHNTDLMEKNCTHLEERIKNLEDKING